MGQMSKPTVMANLIRLFDQGVICPAEFWRAVESEVAPGELTAVFGALSASDQDLLCDLFHERPLSLRVMENRTFRRQLRKWVMAR
jgi:hypothetical protein